MSRWGPAGIYVLLILVGSSIRGLSAPPGLGGFDKVAHLLEYGVLGFLLRRASLRPGLRGWFSALLGAGVVATLDELYQAHVPERSSSIWDGVADLVGAGLGAGFHLLLRGKPRELEQNAAARERRG